MGICVRYCLLVRKGASLFALLACVCVFVGLLACMCVIVGLLACMWAFVIGTERLIHVSQFC